MVNYFHFQRRPAAVAAAVGAAVAQSDEGSYDQNEVNGEEGGGGGETDWTVLDHIQTFDKSRLNNFR